MSHTERRKRRERIAADYKAGLSVDKLIKKYGLSESQVRVAIREVVKSLTPEKKFQKVSPEQQEKNCEKGQAKFDAWRDKHLKRCKDLPNGECCPRCHEEGLYLIEKQENVYFICCNKLRANYKRMGYKCYTDYFMPNCGC